MNYEKPRPFGDGVHIADRNTTPRLARQGKPVPRLSGSSALDGSPSSRRDDGPYSVGENGVAKENIATPIQNIMNANVTPRSSSRKARAETASPSSFVTPDGTPATSRSQSVVEKRDRNSIEVKTSIGFNVRNPADRRTSQSQSLISDDAGSPRPSRPVLMERNNSSHSSNGLSSPKGPSLFFHANDVQATVSSKPPTEKALPQPRTQGWINTVEGGNVDKKSAINNNSISHEQSRRFVYANGPAPSKSPPPRPLNANTSNRPPLQTIYSAQAPTSPRAPSPLKEELIPQIPRKSSISKASPRRHTRLTSNGGSEIRLPEVIKTDLSRRSSLNSRTGARTPVSHNGSHSAQSTERSSVRRNSLIGLDTSLVEPTKRVPMAGANEVLSPRINQSTSSFSQEYSSPLSPGIPPSPTKPPSKLDQINELAANARRERKVLDLEISNSSLLAINRTLEREMRKQNAELRRYRRLSRSGRLSLAPTSHSGRKLSKTDAGINSDDVLSATDSEGERSQVAHSVTSSTSNVPDSPIASAARGRFHDPESSSLDLSAHRLLLLESQKMNQAIKRCLSHTDALIAAAGRAVDCHYTLEPEKLGRKVLTPDEYDDSVERSQGLLSPGLGSNGSNTNPWERSLAQIGALDGGLETPDYSKWGSEKEPELPILHPDDSPLGMPIADGVWNGDAGAEDAPPSSPLLEPAAKLPHLPSSPPGNEDLSFQASLDGLDSDRSSPIPAPVLEPDPNPGLDHDSTRPPSPSRLPPTTNAAANTPGNRSSIQNFGAYLGLQSLSIFGQPTG